MVLLGQDIKMSLSMFGSSDFLLFLTAEGQKIVCLVSMENVIYTRLLWEQAGKAVNKLVFRIRSFTRRIIMLHVTNVFFHLKSGEEVEKIYFLKWSAICVPSPSSDRN